MRPQDTGDIQLSEDIKFQERYWKVQRLGWGLFLLVLLAAIAGLLGSGPLSSRSASAPDGSLRAEYERFCRIERKSVLQAIAAPSAAAGGRLRIWIVRDYLQRVDLERVVPQPERVETFPDRLLFTFAAADGQQSVIQFVLEPHAPGRQAISMGVEGKAAVSFRQFIYP